MPIEEILALPVRLVSAEDAHLYIWAPNSFLGEALEVMAAWGFQYRTTITWVKSGGLGVGSYFRNTTEHLLFGTRGTLAVRRADLRTDFTAMRRRHSEKPEEAFQLMEAASPAPRLEMFARRMRPGWTAWGADERLSTS